MTAYEYFFVDCVLSTAYPTTQLKPYHKLGYDVASSIDTLRVYF
jgi:hypothetical protein